MSLPQPWHRGGGNLAGLNTGRATLSHTKLQRFLACEQKYAYTYVQRLQLRATPTPLSLGRAYQLSIEHSAPEVGVDALRNEARISSQAQEDKLRANESIVRAASALYLKRWPSPPDATREYEYLVRLRNPATGYLSRTWDLHGYADEVHIDGDQATLTENKLVGQITEIAIRRLPLDRQLALERYGVWRSSGAHVRQIYYRMMRKPSIKQRQAESIEEFCARIEADYVEREDFYAHEEHLIVNPDDLVRIESELWEWGQRLHANTHVTRDTTQCAEYGGCAFIPLCLGEPGAAGLYEHTANSRNIQTTPRLG